MSLDKKKEMAMKRYQRLIEKESGLLGAKSVRPEHNERFDSADYREDGFVNVLNKYGTQKDTTENYFFYREPPVPDEYITSFYEGNGLFAKIIDLPAEEAVKHGFEIENLQSSKIEKFYKNCLEHLDWEEKCMIAIKWARLFGGAIIVMLIDDGGDLEDPVDWDNVKSIDDLVVYERPLIVPEMATMYHYQMDDPLRTRGSRLGMPERYKVISRYGQFVVHESRCLIFQNGLLPEYTQNSIYRMWGIPEYIKLKRAIRDSEIAHGSAVKMLDRSVQAIYSMKNLSEILESEEGENIVLKRLETIDMARGLLNSITIDAEGEGYDFRQFSYSGVAEIIDSTCNYLSALTSIPQTVLFGKDPTGMNATGKSDLENYYNFVERIQKKMVKSNLRYLLEVIFKAGKHSGEIDEIPKLSIKFNPLWSLSELEQAQLEQQRAGTAQVRAGTAATYIQAQVLDPSEVRKKLAESDEFDIETMLDDYTEEELEENDPAKKAQEQQAQGGMGDMSALMGGGGGEPMGAMPQMGGEAQEEPQAPQGQFPQPKKEQTEGDDVETEHLDSFGSIGVIVIKNGKILVGQRILGDGGSTLCGPGGHIEEGETPVQAASREMMEEFGIRPKDLLYIGRGPEEFNGLQPYIFICTDYEGKVCCKSSEIKHPVLMSLEELKKISFMLFQPFKDSLNLLHHTLNHDTEQNIGQSFFTKSIDNYDGDSYNSIVRSENANFDSSVKYAYGLAKAYGIDTEEVEVKDIWRVVNEYEKKNGISKNKRKVIYESSYPKKEFKLFEVRPETKDARNVINKRIASGSFKTDIDESKQAKHFKGSETYNRARKYNEKTKLEKNGISYFTISKEELSKLIKENLGKGLAWTSFDKKKPNRISCRETVVLDKPIGVWKIDANGKSYKTNAFVIHYSKTGVHAVPSMPTIEY